MSTANFRTQEDFDLFVTDYAPAPLNDLIADGVLEETATSEDYNNYLQFDEQIFWEDFKSNFENELPRLESTLRKALQYHKITLEGGHYFGVQLLVEPSEHYYEDPSELDNDDCQYIYGLCRSKAIREYKADKKRTARLMELIAKEIGMEKYNCVGFFSNGEAIYRKA